MNYTYTTDTILGREQDRPFNAVVNQYAMFNERPSVMFDSNAIHSSPILSEETNPLMLIHPMNPIPTNQHFQHPWNPLHDDYSTHHHVAPSERGIAGFVSKLYQCLQSPESNQKYARWCQHEGKDMFVIDCIPEFTEIVLPRLFKHCKFASFVRQLNIYGFQRDTDARKSKDTKEKESCRWYHPCFKPNRRDLFHMIRRKATRYSRKSKAKASMSEEDPETILNVGFGDDESVEMDQDNMVLIVRDDHTRRSSSISSVNTMLPTLNYSTSQLQPGFSTSSEPPISASPTTSPSLVHHLSLESPSFQSDEDILSSFSPQDFRLQFYQMRQKHEQERKEYEGQLQKAFVQIDEQKLHIQQLEEALGFTKHSVKPTTGGYIDTCPTMPSFQLPQHRMVYSKSIIRPDNFYFQDKNDLLLSSPPLVPSNHPSPAGSWHPHVNYVDYHRNSLDEATNGIVTAGSSTVENMVKADELKSATMAYIDSKEKRGSLDVHPTMGFADYM
ncbi:Heat shock factor protein 2 [Choanephora cucurbitarum]|uniref:Heat shock factor protein 2 n=1 Tax=Choanephora cucurbitarum TaxID=101091 RepID=A0A1C7NG42_9FUNG|nr:Heat shock factor protein 2 [Choanephora cucurbitarum]